MSGDRGYNWSIADNNMILRQPHYFNERDFIIFRLYADQDGEGGIWYKGFITKINKPKRFENIYTFNILIIGKGRTLTTIERLKLKDQFEYTNVTLPEEGAYFIHAPFPEL